MSVHFISGKPGGGKTLYAVRLIVEELVHGKRCVVTNVPLKEGRLNQYLQERYPDRCIDLLGRLCVISEDDTAQF